MISFTTFGTSSINDDLIVTIGTTSLTPALALGVVSRAL